MEFSVSPSKDTSNQQYVLPTYLPSYDNQESSSSVPYPIPSRHPSYSSLSDKPSSSYSMSPTKSNASFLPTRPLVEPTTSPSMSLSRTAYPSDISVSLTPSSSATIVHAPSLRPTSFPSRNTNFPFPFKSLLQTSSPSIYPSSRVKNGPTQSNFPSQDSYSNRPSQSYIPLLVAVTGNPSLYQDSGSEYPNPPSSKPSLAPTDFSSLYIKSQHPSITSMLPSTTGTFHPSLYTSSESTHSIILSNEPSFGSSDAPNQIANSKHPSTSSLSPSMMASNNPSTSQSKKPSFITSDVPSQQNSKSPSLSPTALSSSDNIVITASPYEISLESYYELSSTTLLEIIRIADAELSDVYSESLDLAMYAIFHSEIISATSISRTNERIEGRPSRNLKEQVFLQLETKAEIIDSQLAAGSPDRGNSLIFTPSIVNVSIQSFYRSPVYIDALIEILEASSDANISGVTSLYFSRFLLDSQVGSFIEEPNLSGSSDNQSDTDTIAYFLLGGFVGILGIASSFAIIRKRQKRKKKRSLTQCDQRHIL